MSTNGTLTRRISDFPAYVVTPGGGNDVARIQVAADAVGADGGGAGRSAALYSPTSGAYLQADAELV
jgi:hypothetical protein